MSPAEATPVRILVVDDLEDNRTLLVRRLTRQGYQVAEAENGLSALERIGKSQPTEKTDNTGSIRAGDSRKGNFLMP